MQKQEVLFDMKELQKQAAILALGMLFAAGFIYLLIHGFEFHISLSGR